LAGGGLFCVSTGAFFEFQDLSTGGMHGTLLTKGVMMTEIPVGPMKMPNLRSLVARLLGGGSGWQSVTRPGAYVPLQMRKRGPDGKWLYRDPTEKEIEEYLAEEAW
jgi:hypothetical protein